MANRYWIGNSGDWSDTSHWSNATGGFGGYSVPGINDNVYLDSHSFSLDNQIITLDEEVSVLSFITTGVSHSASISNSFFSFNIYGNFIVVANISFTGNVMNVQILGSSNISLLGDTTKLNLYFNSPISSTIYSLQSDISVLILYSSCEFNSNNYNITAYNVTFSDTSTGSLGSSNLEISNSFFCESSLINCLSTSIIVTGATDNFYLFTETDLMDITSIDSTGEYQITFGSNISCENLSISGNAIINIRSDIIINDTLTINGISETQRILTIGSDYEFYNQITISAAHIDLEYVDFYNIIADGATPFSGTSLGDSGYNTDITFESENTIYWVGDSGDWDDINHWSSTSNGTPGTGRIPLPNDIVIFNESSFTLADQEVTIPNNILVLPSMNFSDISTNPPSLTLENSIHITGDLLLKSEMTINGGYFYIYFLGDCSLETDDVSFSTSYLDMSLSELNVNSDLVCSSLEQYGGKLYLNLHILSILEFVDFEPLIATDFNINYTNIYFDISTGSGVSLYAESVDSQPLIFNNLTFNNSSGDGSEEVYIECYNNCEFNTISFFDAPYSIFFQDGENIVCDYFIADGESGNLFTFASTNVGDTWSLTVPSHEDGDWFIDGVPWEGLVTTCGVGRHYEYNDLQLAIDSAAGEDILILLYTGTYGSIGATQASQKIIIKGMGATYEDVIINRLGIAFDSVTFIIDQISILRDGDPWTGAIDFEGSNLTFIANNSYIQSINSPASFPILSMTSNVSPTLVKFNYCKIETQIYQWDIYAYQGNFDISNFYMDHVWHPCGPIWEGWSFYGTTGSLALDLSWHKITPKVGFGAGYGPSLVTYGKNTVNLTYVSLKDSEAIGEAIYYALLTDGCVDDGGNDGWIFEDSIFYWIANSGNWNDITNWSESSGGVATDRIPLITDSVYFDSNSFSYLLELNFERPNYPWFDEGQDLEVDGFQNAVTDTNYFVSGSSSLKTSYAGGLYFGNIPNIPANFIFLGYFRIHDMDNYWSFRLNGGDTLVDIVFYESSGYRITFDCTDYLGNSYTTYDESISLTTDSWHKCEFNVEGRVMSLKIDDVELASITASIDEPLTGIQTFQIWNVNSDDVWFDKIIIASDIENIVSIDSTSTQICKRLNWKDVNHEPTLLFEGDESIITIGGDIILSEDMTIDFPEISYSDVLNKNFTFGFGIVGDCRLLSSGQPLPPIKTTNGEPI